MQLLFFAVPPLISVSARLTNPLNKASLILNVPTDATDNQCLQSVRGTLDRHNGTIFIRRESQTEEVSGTSVMITFADLNLCNSNYSYSVMGIGIVNTVLHSGNVIIQNSTGNHVIKTNESALG